MNENINDYVPSILNPRCVKKHDLSLTQNSIVSRCSLSLKKSNIQSQRNVLSKDHLANKENSRNINNYLSESKVITKNVTQTRDLSGADSLGFSAIEDFQTNKNTSLSFEDFDVNENLEVVKKDVKINGLGSRNQGSFITVSSATELDKAEIKSETTLFYDVNNTPLINVSFGINNCDSVNVTARNGAIKRFNITFQDTSTNVDCEVLERSQISTETEVDENMNETSSSPRKRSAVAVSLEIKKQKLSLTEQKTQKF